MMNDFETVPIGTFKEVTLSRALARAIDDNLSRIDKYNVMPKDVLEAYYELKKHYAWQIENNLP